MHRGTRPAVLFLIWLVPFLVISAMVAHAPFHRSVTPLYHEASAAWRAGKDLYNGPGGMNYLPPFAIFFSPFHALPVPVGDIFWRALAMGLLAGGILAVLRRYFAGNALNAFTWTSILMLPICLGAIRNGQANAMFGGVTLCAAACLSFQRWWWSAAFMGLAMMIKPLGLVLLLLTPALYPAMILPAIVAIAGCLLFPFLFATPDYVLAQYHSCITNLRACAVVTENRFANFDGLVRSLGGELPDLLAKGLRAGAGLLFLGLAYFGGQKANEPIRFLWLYTLATGYLMLFNPMNEYNSYVIFAPALGLWTAWFFRDPTTRARAWSVAAITLSIGILPSLLRPLLGNATGIVWPPLATIMILIVLSVWIFQPRRIDAEASSSEVKS